MENKLKEWAEQYLHIIAKYDGGRGYTWSMAAHELDELYNEITVNMRYHGIRAGWKHVLADALRNDKIRPERDRVRELAKKEAEA